MIDLFYNEDRDISFSIMSTNLDDTPWTARMFCAKGDERRDIHAVYVLPNCYWESYVGFTEEELEYMDKFIRTHKSMIERMCWHPEDFDILQEDRGRI